MELANPPSSSAPRKWCSSEVEVGKTHLAIALRYLAPRRHKTRFLSVADLSLTPEAAQRQRRYREVRRHAVNAYKLVIVDEIGYLPMSREQANSFFQVVARRYERGSLILLILLGRWDTAFACNSVLTVATLHCLRQDARPVSSLLRLKAAKH
jgi:DNA replication protein DnaC